MSFFSVQALQEKLNRLTLSQDSIETLSLWIIHHKSHAKTSVDVWLEDVKKGDPDRRLMLFYLANDILQNGRRRGADMFLDMFKDPLRQAVEMISGQKIQTSIERMFRIWKDRKVYTSQFLRQLEVLIEPNKVPSVTPTPVVEPPASSQPPPDFKVSLLEDAVTEFQKFEAELKVKSSHLANLRVNIKNPASSLSRLKDKSDGGRVSGDFDDASQKLQDYCECLVIDVNERINILDLVKECKLYQTHTFDQFQKMVTDYQQLEKSLDSLKENLQQRLKELERAQCTATSDPVSKDDITDIGDMEIESDNESQDTVQAPPPMMVEQSSAKPTVPLGPGHFQTRPLAPLQSFQSTTYQQPRPPGNVPNLFSTGGNLIRETTPTFPIPPPTPQVHPSFSPAPVMMTPSTSYSSPTVAPPLLQQTQPFTGYHPPDRNTAIQTPQSLAVSVALSTPTAPSSLSLNQTPSTNETLTAIDNEEISPSGNKPSLDERLQNMVAHKLFGNVVEYSDSSGSEFKDTPYSPSADELPVSAVATPLDDDQDSIPTPNTGNVTPTDNDGTSPQINLNNPILQALYKTQENSPERTTSVSDELQTLSTTQPSQSVAESALPKNDAMLSAVNTTYLQEILNTVKSVSSSQQPTEPTAMGQTSSSSDKVNPPTKSAIRDIQITPKLTNLLDQIFPQLSKSLQMDRKRKGVDLEETSSTNDVTSPSKAKHPRLAANDITPRLNDPPQRMLNQQPSRPMFSPDAVNPRPFPPRAPGMPRPNHTPFQEGLPPGMRFRAPPTEQMYPPYGRPRPPSFSPHPNHMPPGRLDMKPRAPLHEYGPMGPLPGSIGRGGPFHNQRAAPPMANIRPSIRPRFV